MTHPVPGHPITTPYGKRGPYWSCNKDSAGNGVHTGADMAAPSGTTVVAARPGEVRHTSYGSAFGRYQFAVLCSDGTEDFYAHTQTRPANGARVEAGQPIAKVGQDGNATGPHLHFERHKSQGRWACDNNTDPAPSINYGDSMSDAWEYHYGGKPSGTLTIGTSYKDIDASSWNPAKKGVEFASLYLNVRPKFRAGKTRGALRIRMMRTASNDATAYHDYVIDLDALDDGEQLVTHLYFEKGDGGTTKFQAKCIGGLESVTIGTRYRKGAVDY